MKTPRQHLIALRAAGMTPAEIAVKLDAGQAAIYNRLRGAEPRRIYRRRIADLYLELEQAEKTEIIPQPAENPLTE